ncbi:MAG: 3-hydroxyacyl-[acyl-carrier-protein] dehydratase FabZ [Candidatus Binatia bacterium]
MSAPCDPVPRLPHAVPFVLVDRVVEIGERRGVFLKHVTAADPCVAADGTLPSVFVLEALAQAGGALLAALGNSAPMPGYLAGLDAFECPVVPRVGDTLRLEVEILRHVANATLFRGRALVGDTPCAAGRFTLALPR